MIKAQHKNFQILENEVGIITKKCQCGHEMKRVIYAPDNCPKCGVRFQKSDQGFFKELHRRLGYWVEEGVMDESEAIEVLEKHISDQKDWMEWADMKEQEAVDENDN